MIGQKTLALNYRETNPFPLDSRKRLLTLNKSCLNKVYSGGGDFPSPDLYKQRLGMPVVEFCSGKRIRRDKIPFHPYIPSFFPLGELLLLYLQYLPTAALAKICQVLLEAVWFQKCLRGIRTCPGTLLQLMSFSIRDCCRNLRTASSLRYCEKAKGWALGLG